MDVRVWSKTDDHVMLVAVKQIRRRAAYAEQGAEVEIRQQHSVGWTG